jgi:hypothetical protein
VIDIGKNILSALIACKSKFFTTLFYHEIVDSMTDQQFNIYP